MKLKGLDSLKNKQARPILFLILIFLLVLGIRLYIAFQTPLFNYDAYFSLRQVDNIRSTGIPLYHDTLSYGGKTQLFAPLNYYILTLFSYLMPLEFVGKIIPNIIASLIIFIVYYLSFKISKNNKLSLMTSFMSGFIPIFFIDVNRISVNYSAILLIFAIIYCMLKLNERKYVDYALILMFLLVLTTPMAFVLVLGLLLYLLLLKLENFSIEMKELEIILFFTFLVFWVNLLIYKNAFLIHGFLVIWQNIPMQILSSFFGNIDFIVALGAIGIIPIIFGVYAFYIAFHLDRNKDVLLLISLGISAFVLLWFKLLDIVTGFVFLSITLVILTVYSLKRFDDFIAKSKVHKYEKLVHSFVMVLFLITVIPSMIFISKVSTMGPLTTPNVNDLKVLMWASENTPRNSVIMANLDEGNLLAYYAKRKNVMDTNFLLTQGIDQRLRDIDEFYTTTFETKAIDILNKYNSKYVLITHDTLKKYNITELPYLKDDKCFKLEYHTGASDNEAYLYSAECKIQ